MYIMGTASDSAWLSVLWEGRGEGAGAAGPGWPVCLAKLGLYGSRVSL